MNTQLALIEPNVQVAFSRVWAMPSRYTFTISPIRDLLVRWLPEAEWWADPFAGWNSPAQETNDLNPAAPTKYHEDAEDFVLQFNVIPGLLFDPPYSPRQMSECYKAIGLKVGMKETQNATLYARVKNVAAPRIPLGGIAICCGWNSAGFGIGRGFELVEVLLVPHGAAHNDTIVTVERRAHGEPESHE